MSAGKCLPGSDLSELDRAFHVFYAFYGRKMGLVVNLSKWKFHLEIDLGSVSAKGEGRVELGGKTGIRQPNLAGR